MRLKVIQYVYLRLFSSGILNINIVFPELVTALNFRRPWINAEGRTDVGGINAPPLPPPRFFWMREEIIIREIIRDHKYDLTWILLFWDIHITIEFIEVSDEFFVWCSVRIVCSHGFPPPHPSCRSSCYASATDVNEWKASLKSLKLDY